MKDVRNQQLRKKLEREGIKDIVLNFSEGTCLVWSEDDETDIILSHTNNVIDGVVSFNQMTVDSWVQEIIRIFDEGLEVYERSKKYDKNHIIIMK